jgi:hypothetical protein
MLRGCGYDEQAAWPGASAPGGTRPSALLGQPALEEGAGVHAGGGVPLEVDLVAAALVVLAAEEVVEADLVQRGSRGVGGDVAADADAGPLRAVHHDRRVPAGRKAGSDARPASSPGNHGSRLGRDGVDVVRASQARHAHVLLGRAAQERQHDVARAVGAGVRDQRVERVDPLARLVRVDVDVLGGETACEQRLAFASRCHGTVQLLGSQGSCWRRRSRCAAGGASEDRGVPGSRGRHGSILPVTGRSSESGPATRDDGAGVGPVGRDAPEPEPRSACVARSVSGGLRATRVDPPTCAHGRRTS